MLTQGGMTSETRHQAAQNHVRDERQNDRDSDRLERIDEMQLEKLVDKSSTTPRMNTERYAAFRFDRAMDDGRDENGSPRRT